MATFTINSPDGKAYTIEGDNAEGALAALQKHLGADQIHVQAPAQAGPSLLTPRRMADVNPFEEFRQKPANPFEQYRQNPAADYSKMSDTDLLRVVGANPIRVSAPDGSIVHFPAGTSDETINGAMRKAYLSGTFGGTPAAPSVAADVVKSAGIGIAKGTLGLAGMPGLASDFLARASQRASNFVADKLGMDRGPQVGENLLPNPDSLQKRVEGYTGDFYKPKTVAGEYAQTAGEFAPALIGGPETLAAKLFSRVAVPAVASEAAGQATKGTAAEPYARAAAAFLSPVAASTARRVITPLPASVERTALANNLTNEGVDLTAGQRTGSKPLQWAESTLGDMPGSGGPASRIQENQAQQFTAAALRRVGETADRADGATIDNAFNRIGGQFDAIGARNRLVPDPQLGNDLAAVQARYDRMVGPNARVPAVYNTIADIADQVGQNGGHLGGDQYVAMRSQLGSDARAARNDPYLQEALHGHQEALDNAFERTLQAAGNPQDIAALREARNQYRNMMVIEKAATGAGSATAEGLISPSQLRNATVTQNRRAYARGQGDFADLARSGEAVMKPLPQSGTAPRQNIQNIMSIIGSVAGGATAGLPGALAGIAAPAVAGRVLMSRPVQAYLGNQVVGPAGGSRGMDAVRAALLAASAPR
jgi:hypothetical protein